MLFRSAVPSEFSFQLANTNSISINSTEKTCLAVEETVAVALPASVAVAAMGAECILT